MTIRLLLLAAGAARRMRGGEKLLEDVDGQPLLRALCERGLAAGLDVTVSLPNLTHPRAVAVADLPVQRVAVPNWRDGMAASLKAGLDGVTNRAVMILPADMPEITTEDLRRVASTPGRIVQATSSDGRPGHPVRFDATFFGALQSLTGDVGARAVLRAHQDDIVRIALPAEHALTDLDTPEDWAGWRAKARC